MFYSPEVIGWYGLASAMLRRPVMLISQSLNVVFFQNMTVLENKGKNQLVILLKTTLLLFSVGIIPFIVIFFFAEDIFQLLFGNEWSAAGVYAKILSPWLFSMFITFPSDQIVVVKQLLGFKMAIELVYLISVVVVIYGGAYILKANINVILSAFSAVGFFRCIFVLIMAFKHTI